LSNKSVSKNLDLERKFSYHPPKLGQPEKYEIIRSMAKDLAYRINELCPDCEEKYESLKRLQESVFWANAGIARNE